MNNGFGSAILPLIIGGIIGFTVALMLSTPRRRQTAAAPSRQRALDVPRPAVAAQTAADGGHRAEAKRLANELAAARREVEAAVQARKSLVAAHQAELERRDRSIADRKTELQERDTRVAMLLERVAALGGAERAASDDAPTVDLRVAVEQAQAAARAAELKVQERDQRIVQLQKEMGSVREELGSVRKRSGELSRSVEELTPRFAERNRQIAQLETALLEAQAELARRPVAAPAVVVDPAAAEKAANAKLLAAYKHDMALVEEEKAALRRELAKRDARIQKLTERGTPKSGGAAGAPGVAPVVAAPVVAAPMVAAPVVAAPDESVVDVVVEAGARPGAERAVKPADAPNGAPPARAANAKAAGKPRSDDLKRIKGIGPVYARLLAEAGITTFAGLAKSDAQALAAAVTRDNGVPPDVAPWIDEARAFASGG